MGADGNTPLLQQQAIELAGPKDVRLFFSGPPKAVTGTIPLVNPSANKQRIRAVAVSAGHLKGVTGLPLRELSLFVKLNPGERANVSGTIRLDRQTPPASHEIEITVGSRTVPATVDVTEFVDLRIQPGEITIVEDSRSSFTRKFIVENVGNVAMRIGGRSEAPIFDSVDLVSTLLTGLHKADKASAESMAKGFLKEWSDLQAGTLAINWETLVLRPGHKQVIDVEFQLSPDLKPLRQYNANLQLYNATVSMEIYAKGLHTIENPARSKKNAR
jgi:hypothetical protein